MNDIHELLQIVVEHGASDLHLSANNPPRYRVAGRLVPIEGAPVYEPDLIQKMLYSILNNEQRKNLELNWELDCSYGVQGLGRFRVNVFRQKGTWASVLRTIPTKVPSFEGLGLPPVIRDLAKSPRGLILVTGPTGSGKSTTLAAMVDFINSQRYGHIITIEDPIEFLHESRSSLINQRELHGDTKSFANALKASLREDPDVILVGEMRDLDTISLAITAAETGHLVFGTLHTNSAASTIDRIIDVFPSTQQSQIRTQLGNGLVAVISQTLIPKLEGRSRVAAHEIMVVTPGIANLIREGKTSQLYSAIQTGAKQGMQTLEMALRDLYLNRKISFESALEKTSRPEDFMRMVGVTPQANPGQQTGATPLR